MSDVVAKVEKLIALSASSNENESRNAAAMACRLIREHRLSLRSSAAPPASAPRPTPPGGPGYASWADIFRAAAAGVPFDPFDINYGGRVSRNPPPPAKEPWAAKPKPPPEAWPWREDVSTANYDCGGCTRKVAPGDRFFYPKNGRVRILCARCGKCNKDRYEGRNT